jgi:uncharacterized repeat protein (TIGR01451 family)
MQLRALTRTALTASGLAALLVGALTTASAGGTPQYNCSPGDATSILVYDAARPAGQQWVTSMANITPGTEVRVMVRGHNCIPDANAINNATYKATLPTGAALSQQISGRLSGDNVQAFNLAPATLSYTTQSELQYVSGSARYLYRANGEWINPAATVFPNGTNGDGIVSAQGINMGVQQACTEFTKVVTFSVKVVGGTPAIKTNKAVSNSTDPFSLSTTSQPGNQIEYRIYAENTGSGPATTVDIADHFSDARTTLVPNTSVVYGKKSNGDDIVYNFPEDKIKKEVIDGRQKITYGFDRMDAVPTSAIYVAFKVQIADKDKFTIGETNISNCAVTSFGNLGTSATTACTNVKITRQEDPKPSLTVRKDVANITNGSFFYYPNEVPATPGDRVAYRIEVANTGDADAQNVSLRDALPQQIAAIADTAKMYGPGLPATGKSVSVTDLVSSGLTLGTVKSGNVNAVSVVFYGQVTNQCSGNVRATNTAIVRMDGADKGQDTADVLFGCTKGLTIRKEVSSIREGFVDNTLTQPVYDGEVVRYKLVVGNTGNTQVNAPVVSDVLPAQLERIGNIYIDGAEQSATISDAFFAGGITLANFAPGHTKEITFQVRVKPCQYDMTITNTASIKGDGVAPTSDSATFNLIVRAADINSIPGL